VVGNDVFEDRPPPHQVLRDDPLEHRRVARPVPDSLRVDNGNRSTFTDSEAIGLRAKDSAFLGQPELFQSSFEKLPGQERPIFVATFGLCLIATQKDVPCGNRDTDFLGHTPETVARFVTTGVCLGFGVLIHRGLLNPVSCQYVEF
jgi:hypothetical protein